MKKIKKIMVASMVCLGIFATNITAYAKPVETPIADATVSVTATTPACPRCHTNKWVVAHGLVCWSCLKCKYDFW
ncbi:MAG: hypothetical protein PHY47_23220 [Lachnospiraceae bacterium]|nr:hypothetical protein [Lachnospiraceae bacterium]